MSVTWVWWPFSVLHWQHVHEGVQQDQGSRTRHGKENLCLPALWFSGQGIPVRLYTDNLVTEWWMEPICQIFQALNLTCSSRSSLNHLSSKSYCSVVNKQHSKACNLSNLEFDVGIAPREGGFKFQRNSKVKPGEHHIIYDRVKAFLSRQSLKRVQTQVEGFVLLG